MPQYFCTESRRFDDPEVKFKSGQIVDLPADAAASFNRQFPGLFEVYDAAKHTPAPKLDVAVVEVAAVETAPVKEESSTVQDEPASEVKADKKPKKTEKPAA